MSFSVRKRMCRGLNWCFSIGVLQFFSDLSIIKVKLPIFVTQFLNHDQSFTSEMHIFRGTCFQISWWNFCNDPKLSLAGTIHTSRHNPDQFLNMSGNILVSFTILWWCLVWYFGDINVDIFCTVCKHVYTRNLKQL